MFSLISLGSSSIAMGRLGWWKEGPCQAAHCLLEMLCMVGSWMKGWQALSPWALAVLYPWVLVVPCTPGHLWCGCWFAVQEKYLWQLSLICCSSRSSWANGAGEHHISSISEHPFASQRSCSHCSVALWYKRMIPWSVTLADCVGFPPVPELPELWLYVGADLYHRSNSGDCFSISSSSVLSLFC